MKEPVKTNLQNWQLFVEEELVMVSSTEQDLIEQARAFSKEGKVVTRELWNGNVIKQEFSLENDRFVKII